MAVVACTLLVSVNLFIHGGHSEKTDVCSHWWLLLDFVPLQFVPGTCCVDMSVTGKALRYLDAYQFVRPGRDKLLFLPVSQPRRTYDSASIFTVFPFFLFVSHQIYTVCCFLYKSNEK